MRYFPNRNNYHRYQQQPEYHDPVDKPFKKPRNYTVIVLGVFFIAAVMLGSIMYITSNNKNDESENIHNDEEGYEIDDISINIEADVEIITDCDDKNCFEKKFEGCEHAKVTLTVLDNLASYYEIIGPEKGLCEMKFKYPANPNPEWVNKEMICLYNNSKSLDVATREVFDSLFSENIGDCRGELFNAMKKF